MPEGKQPIHVSRCLSAVAVGCLLILAGCSGFFGADTTTSASPTSTPAPVPSDAPTPDQALQAVPGLSAEGVEDAFALGRAHRAVLANVSYTQRVTEPSRFANGTLRLNTTTVTRVEPMNTTTRWSRVTTYEGRVDPVFRPHPTAIRVETYAAVRIHHQVTFPNGTTTVHSFDRDFGVELHTLEQTIAAFDTTVRGRTTCGDRTCYRVRSTALTAPWTLSDAVNIRDEWTVRNASLFALVDDRGLVREYRVRYSVETSMYTYTAVRHVRYTAFGDTTVETPDWVTQQTP